MVDHSATPAIEAPVSEQGAVGATSTVPERNTGLGIARIPILVSEIAGLARIPLHQPNAPTGPDLLGHRQALDSDIGTVHVRHVPGKKPWSIVLAHGWSGSADVTWHALMPHLAGGPSIYAIDLPGHGNAKLCGPFDLEGAARHIAVAVNHAAEEGPVALVGFSLGGAASLTGFSMGLLGAVDRYVAVATADRFTTPSLDMKLWAGCIFGAGDRSKFILQESCRRTQVSKREMTAWISSNRPSRDVLADSAAALMRFDLSGAELPLPENSEWIVTRADTVVSPTEQIESARRHHVAISELDTSHAATLEHPSQIARLLTTQRKTAAHQDRRLSNCDRPRSIYKELHIDLDPPPTTYDTDWEYLGKTRSSSEQQV